MSAQYKFRDGDEVLVSVRGGNVGHDTEQEGVVTEVAGKGAFVKLKRGGNSNFFYFGKIRRNPKALEALPGPAKMPKPGPFKLADVARITPPKHFEQKPESPTKPGVPLPSTIGQLIFKIRQDCGAMQDAFARAIGITAGILSAYERDIQKPKDDDLLRIAEVFDVDLTLLVEASERFARPEAKAPDPPAALVYLAETEAVAQGAPGTIAVERFQAFVERLADLAPIPAERAMRHDWFERARGFFWESGGGNG